MLIGFLARIHMTMKNTITPEYKDKKDTFTQTGYSTCCYCKNKKLFEVIYFDGFLVITVCTIRNANHT